MNAVCQGDNAWTDGQQIVLPSVPEPLDEDLEKCLIGYLDHEMGHVAFSDFGVAEQFAKLHPGFEGLLNVIEDALIKRRATDRGGRAVHPALGGREGRSCDAPRKECPRRNWRKL